MSGWVKLWRKSQDSDMVRRLTSKQRDVMIQCLLLANHAGREWEWKGQVIKCDPGQFVTSLESLRRKCAKDVSIQNIRTALLILEKYQFLTSESTKTGRMITITKWSTYQADQQSYQQGCQQRANKELTTNKNDKNDKEEEEEKETLLSVSNFDSFKNGIPSKQIAEAWNDLVRKNVSTMPQVAKISPDTQRYTHIRARWKMNPDLDVWKIVMDKATKSPFLNGRVKKFCASFDWLIKSQDNFTKTLEGNYDDKNQVSSGMTLEEFKAEFNMEIQDLKEMDYWIKKGTIRADQRTRLQQ